MGGWARPTKSLGLRLESNRGIMMDWSHFGSKILHRSCMLMGHWMSPFGSVYGVKIFVCVCENVTFFVSMCLITAPLTKTFAPNREVYQTCSALRTALRHPCFADYLQHCERALRLYGEHAFATLSSAKHFNEWLAEQKSEDPLVVSMVRKKIPNQCLLRPQSISIPSPQ